MKIFLFIVHKTHGTSHFVFYKINYIIYAEHMQSVILMCQIPVPDIKKQTRNPRSAAVYRISLNAK